MTVFCYTLTIKEENLFNSMVTTKLKVSLKDAYLTGVSYELLQF